MPSHCSVGASTTRLSSPEPPPVHGQRLTPLRWCTERKRGRTAQGVIASRASRVLVTRDFSLTGETIAFRADVLQNVRADARRPFNPCRVGGRPYRGGCMAKLTPIERFISDIPADRRRAFDARQFDAGITRVTVSVPLKYVDDLKTIARFFRNSSPETVEMYRVMVSEYLADLYRDWDQAEAEGRL